MRDYLHEMLKALTSAYSHKDHDSQRLLLPVESNIGKLFSIFAWGLNMVQEQAGLIKLWDHLEHARGSVLDRYGANFGVKREGASDAFYRLAIKVKVLSQLSGGDTDTVINAAAELLGVELTDILYEDDFPAKIALYVDQDLLSEDRLEMLEPIAWAIKRIIAAGVGMRLYERTYRTYRYDFLVNHGGGIGTFFSYEPIGKNREAIIEMPFTHSAAVRTDFDIEPTAQDRVVRTHFDISRGSDLKPGLSSAPVSQDISVRQSVSVPRGVFLPQTVSGAPSGVKVVSRHQSKDVGGAYTRTRIKPKRID